MRFMNEGQLAEVRDDLSGLKQRIANVEDIHAGPGQRLDIFDHVSDAVAVGDIVFENGSDSSDIRLEYINPAFEQLWGISRSDAAGRTMGSVLPGIDRDCLKSLVAEAMQGRQENSHGCVSCLGRSLKVRASVLSGGKLALIIKEEKTGGGVEQALMESERRFQTVLRNIRMAALMLDSTGRVTFCNEFFLEQCGWRRQDVLGKDWFDNFLSGGLKEKARSRFRETMSGGEILLHTEAPVSMPDGNHRVFFWNHTILRNDRGDVAGLACLGEDITEKQAAERQRSILSKAIEQAAESVSITDSAGRLQYVNPAFEMLSGYSRQEVLGKTPRILKSGKHSPHFYGKIWGTICRGHVWKGQVTNRKKNGDLYDVEMAISPVRDRSGQISHFVAVKRDVTREKNLETQLRQSQKMEAIGTLAGGIAHDFNNILGAIVGYTELSIFDSPRNTDLEHNLNQVLKAGKRAKELVRHILRFSRQSDIVRQPTELGPIVEEAMKLVRASLPATIDIQTVISDGDGLVMADPTQIHQVILNLCTNAAQGMEETGGRLTVTLDEIEIPEKQPDDQADLSFGRYVRLSVKDSGPGIPPALKDRIFEPYFTTKPSGEGTGLGLAIVHGIVKSHKGVISVSSEPGEGALFSVYLPEIESGNQPGEGQTLMPLESGHETILVVDDEPALVELQTNILERLGYNVVAKSCSQDALETFRRNPQDVDVIITDYTMPHLTGVELSRKVLEIRPDMPIILCTGFSQKINREKANEMGIRGFIMKPVVISEMARLIRDVLTP